MHNPAAALEKVELTGFNALYFLPPASEDGTK